jgi:hypothetical protein
MPLSPRLCRFLTEPASPLRLATARFVAIDAHQIKRSLKPHCQMKHRTLLSFIAAKISMAQLPFASRRKFDLDIVPALHTFI